MELFTTVYFTYTYDVVAVSKDKIDLVMTILRQKTNFTSIFGKDTSYETTEGPASVKKPLRMTINEKGIVTKQDKELKFSFTTTGNGSPGSNNLPIDLFVASFFGRALKPGNSFSDSTSFKSESYSESVAGIYTVHSLQNEIASLSYIGLQHEEVNMFDTKTATTGKVATQVKVNIRTGIILEKRSVIETSSDMQIEGKKVPMTGKTFTNIKIQESTKIKVP